MHDCYAQYLEIFRISMKRYSDMLKNLILLNLHLMTEYEQYNSDMKEMKEMASLSIIESNDNLR